MYKIGVTGGIGAGKTVVCEIFSKLNIPVFTADSASRKLLETDQDIHRQLRHVFGEKIFDNNGLPDRKAISQMVFNNKKNLVKLNAIVHPGVKKKFLDWAENQNAPYVINEAAIMFESGSHKLMDKIIMVYCEKEKRVERIMRRNSFSREHIEQIMANQMRDEEKCKKADFIVYNNEKTLLLPQIIDIHLKLTEK